MSQQPPLPEVTHNVMLLQILEKTSPIVEPRPLVLISSTYLLFWINTFCFFAINLLLFILRVSIFKNF